MLVGILIGLLGLPISMGMVMAAHDSGNMEALLIGRLLFCASAGAITSGIAAFIAGGTTWIYRYGNYCVLFGGLIGTGLVTVMLLAVSFAASRIPELNYLTFLPAMVAAFAGVVTSISNYWSVRNVQFPENCGHPELKPGEYECSYCLRMNDE